MHEFDCRFCDETPFVGWRHTWDRENDRAVMRYYEARLQVRPAKMLAELATPNGVQVLWSHGGWRDPSACGRVLTMEFSGSELLGRLAVRDEDLRQYVPGGVAALADGINRGLSVGVQYLESPPITVKLQDGTPAKPDLFTFGKVRIIEVSLTPQPRLHTAGILSAVEPPPVEAGETQEEPTDAEAD